MPSKESSQDTKQAISCLQTLLAIIAVIVGAIAIGFLVTSLGSGLVIFKERKPGYCRRHGGSHACTCFIFPKASWNVSNHSFPVLTVLPVWMTGASSATSSMGSLMFDSTHLKTHHMASILLKKRILHVSSVEQKEA